MLAADGRCKTLDAGANNFSSQHRTTVTITNFPAQQRLHVVNDAGMLAADGRCKTLDAGADGYVRSEGLGLVALRCVSSLDPEAGSCGSGGSGGGSGHILVSGSAVNQDGRSSGLTAPNGPSQQNLICTALANAHLPAHMVSLRRTIQSKYQNRDLQ